VPVDVEGNCGMRDSYDEKVILHYKKLLVRIKIKIGKEKLIYGPRDVDNISWAYGTSPAPSVLVHHASSGERGCAAKSFVVVVVPRRSVIKSNGGLVIWQHDSDGVEVER